MSDSYNGYGDEPVTYDEVRAALADADAEVRSLARAALDELDAKEAAARPQPPSRSDRFAQLLSDKIDEDIARRAGS